MWSSELEIRVVDLPLRTGLRLECQGKKGNISGEYSANTVVFRVPLVWKTEARPSGDFVRPNGDGRFFIYLTWYEGSAIIRRIKLYTHQWQGDSVVIQGTDKHGMPACSTAVIAE
jgi:hypothetical protein